MLEALTSRLQRVSALLTILDCLETADATQLARAQQFFMFTKYSIATAVVVELESILRPNIAGRGSLKHVLEAVLLNWSELHIDKAALTRQMVAGHIEQLAALEPTRKRVQRQRDRIALHFEEPSHAGREWPKFIRDVATLVDSAIALVSLYQAVFTGRPPEARYNEETDLKQLL